MNRLWETKVWIYESNGGVEGENWEVGLQRRESHYRNGEVLGGCLECRQIAQRGRGRKHYSLVSLPNFK